MKGKYVSLDDDFTLRHSNEDSTLYCLRNGAIYELYSDQVELMKYLDGSLTVDEILDKYSNESQVEVTQFLESLSQISALCFSNVIKIRQLQLEKAKSRRLESVHLEASGRCNLNCVHCYQAEYVKSKTELTHIEIMHLLDDLQSMQVNNVGISGGEPLMMQNLEDVLIGIEDRDMRISALFSNGLLVDSKFVRMIKERKSIFPVFISLDSIPGENITFRGVSNKNSQRVLNRILNNIKLLIEGGVDVVINTVVNNENIANLDKMYSLISGLGVSSWRIGFPKLTNQFVKYAEDFDVGWCNIAEHCFSLLERHLESNSPFHLQIEYLYREELFSQGLQILSDTDFVCDYEGRRSECCVKPNGDIVSCAYCTDLPIGNIKESSIKDIWYSAQMNQVKMIEIGDVAECKGCELRELCGTGCRANAHFLHGDFNNAKDDYACMAVAFFKDRVVPLLQKYNKVK